MVGQRLDGRGFEEHLHVRRHVVEEERQRQRVGQRRVILDQLLLRGCEIVGCGGHDCHGAARRGVGGQFDALVERCVGDAHQYGDASGDLTADQFDEIVAAFVGEALRLAGGAEEEKCVDAAGEDVFREPYSAFAVDLVVTLQGGNHRGNDPFDSLHFFMFLCLISWLSCVVRSTG